MMDFVLLVLLAFLVFVLCTDFYRVHAKFTSPRLIWLMRMAEVITALIFGYFCAIFFNIESRFALLFGIAATVFVFILAFIGCHKGVVRDVLDAQSVKLMEVMEQWKEDFLRDVRGAEESVKKSMEAELAVYIDEIRRRVENFMQNMGEKLVNLNEMLSELRNILNNVRSGAESFVGSIKCLSDLENRLSSNISKLKELFSNLSDELKEAQALTDVHAEFERLTAELRKILENLASRMASPSAAKAAKGTLMEKLVKILKGNGFDVTIGHGRDKPKLLAKVNSKTVFAATLRAFTFSEKIKQRRIFLNTLRERDYALAHKVDLVIFVGNLANDRIWVHRISWQDIEKSKFIDTPICLVEKKNEATEECEKSLKHLLEYYSMQ